MSTFSLINKTSTKLALAVVFAASLAACGGGSGTPTVAGASTNAAVAAGVGTEAKATTALVAAVSAPIVFTNGFSGTDATGATVTAPAGTSVAFSAGATATAPTVTVSSGGDTATGTTTFGSCKFTFNANSPFIAPKYAANHPFGPGKSFIVHPCSISIPTAGTKADSPAQIMNMSLTFGVNTATKPVSVVVKTDGSVTVDGKAYGAVDITLVTGVN